MQSPQHMSSLERPATAFLSYAREDVERVKYLQLHLKVRGVRAWRDVTDLGLGYPARDEIVRAIEQEADAFVMYITQQSLASRFIWDIEVRTALKRQEHDPEFKIVPILSGVTFPELEQHCATRSYRSLANFNGVRLPDNATAETEEELREKLRSIAERTLRATIALRLRRAKADNKYEPWIRLWTFKDKPQTPYLDLDLDWWELFRDRERLPGDEEWREVLFPALQDVKHALGESPAGRNLHMSLKAILPVAFALGFAFPATSSFTLLPESNDGTWSTAGKTTSTTPLRRMSYDGGGDRHVAVIEIAISDSTAQAVSDYLQESKLSYSDRLRYDLPDGSDHHEGVKDAAHALAIARQIGRELRVLCGQGVSHVHLFAAIPAALAVLVGNQFNALCPVSVYQYAHGRYERACVLG